MADQGLWFKLWCAALDDPDLDNLSLEDFGRWAKLGALVKRQGQDGSLTFSAPARALCALFQVERMDALLTAFSRLPNVTVRSENGERRDGTVATVSFANWAKYQGDYSTARTRRFRDRERFKRRGEETRRDENIAGAVSRTKTGNGRGTSRAPDETPRARLWTPPVADPPTETDEQREHRKTELQRARDLVNAPPSKLGHVLPTVLPPSPA